MALSGQVMDDVTKLMDVGDFPGAIAALQNEIAALKTYGPDAPVGEAIQRLESLLGRGMVGRSPQEQQISKSQFSKDEQQRTLVCARAAAQLQTASAASAHSSTAAAAAQVASHFDLTAHANSKALTWRSAPRWRGIYTPLHSRT
jgi:hypothetical protein